MDLSAAIVLLITGGALLWYGGDFLVKGASSFGLRRGVSMMVVGLTIVSMGTSAPELFVSIIAAAQGNPDISVGNVVGSNIANVAFVLGASALLTPLTVRRSTLVADVPFVLASSVLLWVTVLDGSISRVDALLYLALFAGFLAYCVKTGKGGGDEEVGILPGKYQDWLYIIGGIIVLYIGGNYFVTGAVKTARMIGISDLAIGVTVVALGTSLPELATSVIAGLRANSDISVGNVFGSCVFNILLILGVAGLLADLPCSSSVATMDIPFMTALTLLVVPLGLRGKIGRLSGAVLLASYAFYVGFTLVRG